MANHLSFAHGNHDDRIGRVSRCSGVVGVLVACGTGFYLINPVTHPLAIIALALIVWFALGALVTPFVGEAIARGSADSGGRCRADPGVSFKPATRERDAAGAT